MESSRTRALILLGHGSLDNAESSQATREQADEIRRRGWFHEVVAAFYKEEPNMRRVLDVVESDDVFIIPFAISDGYMSKIRWPRELGLNGAETRMGSRRIFYGDALGTHPSMTQALRNCAEQCIRNGDCLPPSFQDLTLVLVGHGTKLHRHSRGAVLQQVEWLTKEGTFAEILPAFLEEEPYDREVLEKVKTSHVVVVPFFLGRGQHAMRDLPMNLGLISSGEKTWRVPTVVPPKSGVGPSRTVWYSRTLGSDPWIADLILDRVRAIEPKATKEIPETERWIA